MTATHPEIVELEANEEHNAVAAAVLAEAFADDPFMAWLFPNPERRAANVAELWRLNLADRSVEESAMMATADHGSVAHWFRPKFEVSEEADEESDEPGPFVLFMQRELGDDDAAMRLRGLGLLQETHPEEPHWYLMAIGTKLAKQGQGQGSALLAPSLERADREGLPCYLESTNPRNLPFYFRHGFEATGEIVMPDGFAALTTMWRRPRGR